MNNKGRNRGMEVFNGTIDRVYLSEFECIVCHVLSDEAVIWAGLKENICSECMHDEPEAKMMVRCEWCEAVNYFN